MEEIYTPALHKTDEWLTIRGTLLNLQWRRKTEGGGGDKTGLRSPVEMPSRAEPGLFYLQLIYVIKSSI